MKVLCEDIALIILLTIHGGCFVVTWNNFDQCYSPIQLAISLYSGLCILIKIASIIQRHNTISRTLRKTIEILRYIIAMPVTIYLGIQGLVWQAQNQKYTPSCLPNFLTINNVWIVVTVMNMASIIFLIIIAHKVKQTWDRFSYRRKMRQWAERTNDDNLRGYLLNMAVEDSMLLRSYKGLDFDKIQNIPKRKYTKGIANMLSFRQSLCSICLVDFQIDEDLSVLPGCGHLYHEGCISAWLVRSDQCPICKKCVNVDCVSQNKQGGRQDGDTTRRKGGKMVEDLEITSGRSE